MSATVFFNSANELATVSNVFKVAGVATDPGAVTLAVTSPTGVATSYTWPSPATLTRTGAGAFTVDIPCNEAGTWQYQWDGTTTASDATAGTWEVLETQLGRLYCTVEALKSRVGIALDDTDDDFELHAACLAASRSLEQHCHRMFWRTAATEVRTFVPDNCYCVTLGAFNDLVTVTTLKTDSAGDGSYGTTWATGEYQLHPVNPNAGPEQQPYTSIQALTRTFPLPWSVSSRRNTIQITGVFGWPAVPWSIKMAARILAQDAFKLKDTSFGASGEGEFVISVGDNRRAERYANPYRLTPVLVG